MGVVIKYVPAGSNTTCGCAALATAPAAAMAELMAPEASVVPVPYVAASMVVKTFEYEGMPPGTPGAQIVTRSRGTRPVESVLEGIETTTWAVSPLVGSLMLVAVTWKVPAAPGAVYRPCVSIDPPPTSPTEKD